jgi:hypothetical protein
MKKFLLLALLAIFVYPAINAQPGKLGGGLLFSSGYHFNDVNSIVNKSGNFALTIKHVHKISLPIELSPSFVFYYPHVQNNIYEKVTVSTMMLDIDGHFIFNSLARAEFYGLAGPNLLLTWKKDKYAAAAANPTAGNPTGTEAVTYREKDLALGLNLGAGSYIKLTDRFDLYVEAKYILSKYSQFMLNAGILINIDWLIKHENTGIN